MIRPESRRNFIDSSAWKIVDSARNIVVTRKNVFQAETRRKRGGNGAEFGAKYANEAEKISGRKLFLHADKGGFGAEYANEAEKISGRKLDWDGNFQAEFISGRK
ncbi:hypothetical protein DPMN_122495 [Dreissena polymorpha]|uniref:Uncharacterized protein n=1 Tax=Dreissena polymorpha TaxID=45954 RepID=A0A9D4JQL9_DREPO|nr:hypothetical protein DPMN_122495 [Dreissena polymorpha]